MEKTETKKTLDLTPTWESCAIAYLRVLEDGSDAGKAIAREGIIHMAKVLDHFKPQLEQLQNKENGKQKKHERQDR